jgi:hypothetical protein
MIRGRRARSSPEGSSFPESLPSAHDGDLRLCQLEQGSELVGAQVISFVHLDERVAAGHRHAGGRRRRQGDTPATTVAQDKDIDNMSSAMLCARIRDGVAVLAAAALAVVALPAQSQAAEPQPAQAAATDPTPPTVTADALPTWQINGVVWSQAIIGDVVYVTG